MNVTDFFHLQAAFQTDCIINATTDEEYIFCIRLFRCEPLNTLLVINDPLNLVRQSFKFFNICRVLFLGNRTFYFCKLNSQRIGRNQLCTVCFCCCNRDLRTCKCIEDIVCFTRNRGTNHIYNAKCTDVVFFAETQCCKTVCSLTGLADNDCQRFRIQNRISVTEFGCQLNTNRNTNHIFKYILCSHSHMICRTTCDNINLVNVLNIFICKSDFRKIDLSVFHNRTQSVLNCFRLLVDLFHHEMLETGFFCCFCIPLDCFHLFLDFFTIQVIECDLTFTNAGHLQVSDIIYISCIFQNSRNIRCNVRLSIRNTQNHRAVFTSYIDFFRIIFKHDRKCIRTTDTDHCMIDCIDWCSLVFLVIIIHQFNSNFCIGLRIKCITFAKKFILQLLIVLNDSVMNCNNISIITYMWVCIVLRWFAVSCPSGMSDTTCTRNRFSVICLLG